LFVPGCFNDTAIPLDQRFARHAAKMRETMIAERKPTICPERRLLEAYASEPAAGVVWCCEGPIYFRS
jgi:hypothetical protein